MTETDRYLRLLLQQQGLIISAELESLFSQFSSDEKNIERVKNIQLLQKTMTQEWRIINRRAEINALQIAFPNAVVGKEYKADFDFTYYGLDDITNYQLKGFENSGLTYHTETKTIEGLPTTSGDLQLVFSYNFQGEESDAPVNQKKITIIINPDPKSLWRDIPSDKNDVYAKADSVTEIVPFLDRTLAISSKRGRSHANKGTFRDDDYAYATIENGWGIIAISDGAGSAKFARKGALIACETVIDYFKNDFTAENVDLLEQAVQTYQTDNSIKPKLLEIASQYLSVAAKKAYSNIDDFAKNNNATTSDFHATLAFVLVKRFATGCAYFSFSVGDSPLALVDQSFTEVKVLNKLDVGEYGGGTRFITMLDIFAKADFEERFNFEFISKPNYLVLMTDG
ncbi:MAG: protein phosphatase 2C domain-containing protein, partial [Flavobacteriales bacterium]